MVGVGIAAAVAVRVEIGVNFGRILLICATYAEMDWHAWIPARGCRSIIPRARGPLLLRAAKPAAIARRLPVIVFFVICLDYVCPIS